MALMPIRSIRALLARDRGPLVLLALLCAVSLAARGAWLGAPCHSPCRAASDHVLIFDEDTPHVLLRGIRPDVLVKGGDYNVEQVVGREVVEAYGGKVCVTGKIEGISTTGLKAGLKVPEKAGRLTSGGRKKKCLLPVSDRPSEKSAERRPGDVVGRSSLQATSRLIANTAR